MHWLYLILLTPALVGEVSAAPTTASSPPQRVIEQPLTPGEKAVEGYFAQPIAACQGGDAGACRRLAGRLPVTTSPVELNHFRATLSKACDKGVDIACGELGSLLLLDPETLEKGLGLLRQSCDRKNDFSCARLGEFYVKHEDQKETGRKLLAETCAGAGRWACRKSAQLQLQEKGACDAACEHLLQRGCDGDDPSACDELGRILTEEPAASVAGNASRAFDLFQRGCDRDLASACHNLAGQYLRDNSPRHDDSRGRKLEQKACALGESAACDHLAALESSSETALAIAEKYCDLWGGEACYKACLLLAKEHRETAEVAEKMVTYGQRACLRGNDEACKSASLSARDFNHWCEKGEDTRNSCAFAGFLQLFGLRLPPEMGASVPPDPVKAEAQLRRSCEAGAQVICQRLKELRPRG
jgi:TPR repeat protein